MTLSFEAAIRITQTREGELNHAGWDRSNAEMQAQDIIEYTAWLWRRFELAHPKVAAEFRASVDVSAELKDKG